MGGRYDLVIVGMGSAGMVGAEFATHLGLRVAVVERDRVGGDCLWTGCVPSKALLASAKAAYHARRGTEFGLAHQPEPEIDRAAVWRRLRRIRDDLAATDDNPARFREMGVDVVFGEATLAGPHEVSVNGRRLRTRNVLLCTGSRPADPGIQGIGDAGFLTSETVFELESPPPSVVVVGGGPIAVEMAQALCRLGVKVTVLQRGASILTREEPELVEALQRVLLADGVELCLDVEIERVERGATGKTVIGTCGGRSHSWSAEELFVAVGRAPNVEGLGLQNVGVATSPKGVIVDDRMRTSVASVYAVGDLAGRYLFTHAAAHEAVRAVRDMFLPGRGRVNALVPWCTFTDPELAHAGATESEARAVHGDAVRTYTFDLAHSDRARAEGESGLVKVVLGRRGRLLGAHVLSPAAGEVIHEYALAINEGLPFARLASLVHVYPTMSTSTAQLAASVAFERAARYRPLVQIWKRRPSR